MARARNIKPAFFTNDDLVELPFETRLLFIGLWMVADREGRLVDRPKKIKMEIFPSDDVDCEAGLKRLHASGFIERYQFGTHSVIEIVKFTKHQSPHTTEKDSALPSKDGMFKVYERTPKGGATGNFRLLTQEQLENNVRKPLNNVNPPLDNALNVECGILIPECGILNDDSNPLGAVAPFVVERRAEIFEAIAEQDLPAPVIAKKAAKPRGDAGEDVRAVFTYWQQAMGHPQAKLDAKRERAIKARLKDGYEVGQLCKAVDGCKLSPHHMGQNDNRTVYDDIELICRDGPRVDKFLKLSEAAPSNGRTSNQQQTIDALTRYMERKGHGN